MDNSKVKVVKTKNLGKGLFATRDIKKDELIFDMEGGKVYHAENAMKLPDEARNYCPQFGEHDYICNEYMHYMNHSCEPNCGFKGKFKIVAMKNIKKDEELTFDYEMSEDSNWRMECKCGSKNCRKVIGAFKNMPEKTRKKYKGYISEWLVKKYKL